MFNSCLDKQPVILSLVEVIQRANGTLQVREDGGNSPQQRAQEMTSLVTFLWQGPRSTETFPSYLVTKH